MIVTPDTSSPASTARWIGAAPRQRGNNEAWMFRQPSDGMSSTACGSNNP